MTSLKSCDYEQLLQNPVIAEQFSNYEHILKLCKNKKPVPAISRQTAQGLLSRNKKNVADFYSITASHYLNAGEEGISHFEDLLNLIITDVNNASAEELNVAHGLILHKGHKKEKTSHTVPSALVHSWPSHCISISEISIKSNGMTAKPPPSTRALAVATRWLHFL